MSWLYTVVAVAVVLFGIAGLLSIAGAAVVFFAGRHVLRSVLHTRDVLRRMRAGEDVTESEREQDEYIFNWLLLLSIGGLMALWGLTE